ncbi:MAG: nucleotidyltransferase domain-containing protein [Candidatus Symbiothrix sp.]|jgi:predicted nucleotidyltransferase|nr:nucleotidyltransferase domain-containing protein [Candidatus Symbiothrix sp.]
MNQQILEEIKQLKQEILPDGKLILFGSQARGDATEESDWDLLILLKKSKRTFDDYGNYAYPFTELGWKFGKYFSAKVFTQSDWEKQKPSLFYKNVEHDGIEIV